MRGRNSVHGDHDQAPLSVFFGRHTAFTVPPRDIEEPKFDNSSSPQELSTKPTTRRIVALTHAMSDTKSRGSDDESAGSAAAGPRKHHFTPLELQKKQLDKLLEKIDKPVHIPVRPGQKKGNKEPKDYVKNVQGSSAGAGSGEFHVYRAGRRREYARLKNMELESKEVLNLSNATTFTHHHCYCGLAKVSPSDPQRMCSA